ncbi:SHOCT domain-containing protein [Amaricoccus macauensis]|uniref:SHOCT domain-containing protein n=1 Tax=Amaricoccus macauensis TaxID=57001 RepID=UPI003C7CA37D
MSLLTEHGQSIATDAAARHGVSEDAVTVLLQALAMSNGNQAQFNHPDLGGMGQWSRGGMTMVGDMFNNALKARVDALCTELSNALQSGDVFARAPARVAQSQSQSSGGMGTSLFVSGMQQSSDWWPESLGTPSSVGAQNNLRYAFFPSTRRLAIRLGDDTTVYDTGDHQIGGFSQQQGGDQSLTFTSQHGLVRVADLPKVRLEGEAAGAKEAVSPEPAAAAPAPKAEAAVSGAPEPSTPSSAPSPVPAAPAPQASASSEDDIIAKIEKLAALQQKGILTQAEFDEKKTELLARL